MSSELAHAFSAVFAPEVFLLACTVGLVVYEWRRADRLPPTALVPRFTTIAVAWGIAFLLTELPEVLLAAAPAYWVEDLFAGLGLTAGFLLLAGIWRWRNWGPRLPEFAAMLIVLTIGHSLIVPFWDVSGHVLYTAAPVGYFLTLSRRLVPAVAIPGGMVLSRPLAGAHTWAQSIGGAVLAVAFIVGFLWVRKRSVTPEVEPRSPVQ